MPIYKGKSEITSLADWEALGGPKSRDQWVPDRSAMEAARSWLHDGGKTFPYEVARILATHPDFGPTTSWRGEPEVKLPFDAFAGEPRVVICDEPTSALDVSVQAAILNLLVDLQRTQQVSYIFISHDLGVVRYISDRIAVLYLGRILEIGPAEAVFNGPHHPYTEALLSSVPEIDGRQTGRVKLAGEIPSAAHPPSGCIFHTRCPRKIGAICEVEEPPDRALTPEHLVHCHLAEPDLHRNANT